jgi:hypothetical protein
MNQTGAIAARCFKATAHRSEDGCALGVTGDDVLHPAYARIRCLDELLSGVSPGQYLPWAGSGYVSAGIVN